MTSLVSNGRNEIDRTPKFVSEDRYHVQTGVRLDYIPVQKTNWKERLAVISCPPLQLADICL